MLEWPYTQSPWDGDMEDDLERWGYDLDSHDIDESDELFQCQAKVRGFSTWNRLVQELRINPSYEKNQCIFIRHPDGPAVHEDEDGDIPTEPRKQHYTVDGKDYRVCQYINLGIPISADTKQSTGAKTSFIVNADGGVIIFLDRKSPEYMAPKSWGVDHVDNADLPRLRSSSDIAWAFWNRYAGASRLRNINYFMSLTVINDATQDVLIPRALKIMGVENGIAKKWPGTELLVGAQNKKEREAAAVLIGTLPSTRPYGSADYAGSPNLLAGGYFLLQHKLQLGPKFLTKVRIWQSDEETRNIPNLVLYVDTTPPPTPPEEPTSGNKKRDGPEVESRIVGRSMDGTSVIREHVFRARL
jgi:hypothetical protein